jgi:plastocyanin
MKHRAALGIALLALSAVGLGCASGGSGQGAGERVVAAAGADGVQRVTVVARSFSFSPSRIAVKAGAPVELTISKEPDVIPHNFTLEAAEAGIAVSEKLGTKPKVVRFTPTKPGSYEFYCGEDPALFKSHRSLGMVGTLEVVP